MRFKKKKNCCIGPLIKRTLAVLVQLCKAFPISCGEPQGQSSSSETLTGLLVVISVFVTMRECLFLNRFYVCLIQYDFGCKGEQSSMPIQTLKNKSKVTKLFIIIASLSAKIKFPRLGVKVMKYTTTTKMTNPYYKIAQSHQCCFNLVGH